MNSILQQFIHNSPRSRALKVERCRHASRFRSFLPPVDKSHELIASSEAADFVRV